MPKEAIDYDEFVAEVGERGTNVAVAMVEWDDPMSLYAPDPSGELNDKEFSYPGSTQPSGWFNHATQVCRRIVGRSSSVAPLVPIVHSFGTRGYVSRLNRFSSEYPFKENIEWQVENHSWVGRFTAYSSVILRRVDWYADKYNVLVIAGLNNNTGELPELMANFYNGLGVGRGSGSHSRGGSTLDTKGRRKPEIIAPKWSTSYATAWVTSIAASLIDWYYEENGEYPRIEVVKSAILSGAEKPEDWSNSESFPLHHIWGAGMANIYNSYRILKEKNYRYDTITPGETKAYSFEITKPKKVPITVCWNRHIVHSPDKIQWYYTQDVVHMILEDDEGNEIATSKSDIDNVQHIYQELNPGTYNVKVKFEKQGDKFIQREDWIFEQDELHERGQDWEETIYKRSNLNFALSWASGKSIEDRLDEKRTKIILDTDLAGDCDDVGAVAMAHALLDKNEVEILAMGVSDRNEYGVLALDALNTWYGNPNIPLGVVKGIDSIGVNSRYTSNLAFEYPRTHDWSVIDDAPDAVKVYREALSTQHDIDENNKGVVIITIGFVTNLRNLLESDPDEFSELPGKELVKKKVRLWVSMGGRFPDGTEYNLNRHASASKQVFESWPTPVVFSGYRIGARIITGSGLIELHSKNPVRRAYELWGALDGRHSWDQAALLYAVRGLDEGSAKGYWDLSNPGIIVIDNDGSNSWIDNPDGEHQYKIEKKNPDEIAREIEGLMTYIPDFQKDKEDEESQKNIMNTQNLALLPEAVITGNLGENNWGQRGSPEDIVFDTEKNDYAHRTNWNEYGVSFNRNIGIISERNAFFWMVEWDSPQKFNYLTFGGTYPNQPQPNTKWKIQYKLDHSWNTIDEGTGGWIDRGIYRWGGENRIPIEADAVRVLLYSDGENDVVSVHLRGRGGTSNNENDSSTTPKAVLIQYLSDEDSEGEPDDEEDDETDPAPPEDEEPVNVSGTLTKINGKWTINLESSD